MRLPFAEAIGADRAQAVFEKFPAYTIELMQSGWQFDKEMLKKSVLVQATLDTTYETAEEHLEDHKIDETDTKWDLVPSQN